MYANVTSQTIMCPKPIPNQRKIHKFGPIIPNHDKIAVDSRKGRPSAALVLGRGIHD